MRLAWCTFVLAVWVVALVAGQQCSDGRPPVGERNFVSTAIDAVIEQVASQMTDKDLACIFRNTLPNTLDTTVTFPGGATVASDNLPFVITGDITAMWLTDSMNQVLPYIPYAGNHQGHCLLSVFLSLSRCLFAYCCCCCCCCRCCCAHGALIHCS